MKRVPLRRESAKRRNERVQRQEVRRLTLERAEFRCEGAALAPQILCRVIHGRAPLEVHEVISRGVMPGAHLDVSLTMALCAAHHDWTGQYPEEAKAAGLRYSAWEVDSARNRHPSKPAAHVSDRDTRTTGPPGPQLRLVKPWSDGPGDAPGVPSP